MYIRTESVPQFLKENGRFCNWKYEQRGGRQTKVPYIPGTTRRASVDDLSAFTDFEAAASATGYDGIGICVCGRIVGIDLDHCIEDGKPLPWAKEIVDRFSATYVEVSPSGRGITSSAYCRTALPMILRSTTSKKETSKSTSPVTPTVSSR